MKPIYDRVVKSSQSLKEIYLTYRNRRSTQSRGSLADANEEKDQARDHRVVQGLAPASKKNDHHNVNGLMEVGLWSSHGGETVINTQTDDGSIDDRAWPYSPNTSYLLV